jgi:hypothetical protein
MRAVDMPVDATVRGSRMGNNPNAAGMNDE